MSDGVLHITNGDGTASLLQAAGIGGDVLPWRDVLYDGPVPSGHSLESLSDVRAGFLARQFRQPRDETRAQIATRDTTLRKAGSFAEIVLWFEHDLYDQLQILQILDALASDEPARNKLSKICIDRFPGVAPFHGLGQLSPDQIAGLWPRRQPVNGRQLSLAQTGWRAFTAADPRSLNDLRDEDTRALPFLDAAIARLMADYPSRENGLPRTEQGILDAVADGKTDPISLFRDNLAREAAPFLGDWSFWWRLAELCDGPEPLLSCVKGGEFRHPRQHEDDDDFKTQRFGLTDTGHRVRAGDADAVALNGIDRWAGGVHLKTGNADWRYDPAQERIVRESA